MTEKTLQFSAMYLESRLEIQTRKCLRKSNLNEILKKQPKHRHLFLVKKIYLGIFFLPETSACEIKVERLTSVSVMLHHRIPAGWRATYSRCTVSASSNNKTLNARLLARVITGCHYT
jgi:hypothetical protein